MTMTVLDLLVLAEVLMRLMSRIIEIFLMLSLIHISEPTRP